jgi:hypothetical protein
MWDRVTDCKSYLSDESECEALDPIRRFSFSGRPAGDEAFVESLEALIGRELRKKKPRPKPRIK